MATDNIPIAAVLAQQPRPETPPHVRRWRRSRFHEPGQRVMPPMIAEDAEKMCLGDMTYGVNSDTTNDDVAGLLRQQELSSTVKRIEAEKNERVYHSQVREPLGKSFRRYELPEKVQTQRFGVGSDKSIAAKNLIFPEMTEEALKGEELYRKSHGAFDVGEQKRRNYNWTVDPNTYRFGRKGASIALNGVSREVHQALQSDLTNPAPAISNKRVGDFRRSQDVIGMPRSLGQGLDKLPPDHTFGMPSNRGRNGDWDAAQCLRGDYTIEQQLPDRDLGKSVTPGFRNMTHEVRAFGVPSIRTDLPANTNIRRSIADSQNYGDSTTSRALIAPPDYADLAITSDDFDTLRTREEIESLIRRCTPEVTEDAVFDIVWDLATASSEDETRASINTYREWLNDYILAKREGQGEDWIARHQQ